MGIEIDSKYSDYDHYRDLLYEKKNEKPSGYKILRSYNRENEKWSKNPFYTDAITSVLRIPELELAVRDHKDGQEQGLHGVVRIQTLPLARYVRQRGQTCGLTSFAMILGALGKEIPTYEQLMGKGAYEISGSIPQRDHRRFLNKARGFSDVKETVVETPKRFPDKQELTEVIFDLLSAGNYLYVAVNWISLHGRSDNPDAGEELDHGIVVHGARETEEKVQGSKINFLITDPNSERYHEIWIPSNLLFKAMLDQVEIIGYKIVKPKMKEKVVKRLTGRRPLAKAIA